MIDAMVRHNWSEGSVCSCGTETVICQGCGWETCGAVALYVENSTLVRGNVGPCCFRKFNLGFDPAKPAPKLFTATYVIPADNRDSVIKKIDEMNRKGLKLFSASFRPIRVTFEQDHVQKWMESVDPNNPEGQKREMSREWLRCDVSGEPVMIGDYRFVATLYHTDEGNIINAVPGETLPVEFRDAPPACHHCKQIRRRNDTYVVRHLDGTHKQVGSSCLKDFFGHDPHALVKWAEYLGAFDSWFSGAASEERGPRTEPAFSLNEVLTVTATAIRKDGWLSKGKAKEQGNVSLATASTVQSVLFADITTKWGRELIEAYRETEEDRALATATRDWAQEMPNADDSDYINNLRVVTRADSVNVRTMGLACSMIVAYRKAMNLLAERKAAATNPSNWMGMVGERCRDMVMKVTAVRDFSNDFGPRTMVSMKDDAGNVFVWWTGAYNVEVDRYVYVTGTVKRHGEYKGVKQTELSRCVLETDADTVTGDKQHFFSPVETPNQKMPKKAKKARS